MRSSSTASLVLAEKTLAFDFDQKLKQAGKSRSSVKGLKDQGWMIKTIQADKDNGPAVKN